MSRYKRKKRLNTITELQGVQFIQRTDLVYDNGMLSGKFHIQNKSLPGLQGHCWCSSDIYLSGVTSKPGTLYEVPFDETPKISEICFACITSYRKSKERKTRESEMITIPTMHLATICGEDFVRVSYAVEMLENARKRDSDTIKTLSHSIGNHKNDMEVLRKEKQKIQDQLDDSRCELNNLKNCQFLGGEVRTVQAVEHQEFLLQFPHKQSSRAMRTKITLKKTDVHYKAGQKVRIIIEE